jgi:hypothetical protein
LKVKLLRRTQKVKLKMGGGRQEEEGEKRREKFSR